nr:hypothetical protein BaRGS_003263 [Batillaria attramentaria]
MDKASSMTGVVSNLGMVGVLSGSVGAVQSYSVLGHVLLSFELLYFATVYFHVDYLKSELESCLKDMAVQTYEGPWSDDPTSLSFVIDTYQLKYTCCGFADPNDFENGTAWNRKWKDSQDNEVEAVRPWTCCRLANMAEGNKVYDPTVQTFEVVTGTGDNAFLQSDRCTFDKGSGNDQTCTQRYLEEIEDKTMYGFLIPGLLLIFAQAVGCSLGAYNCKATRNSKVFI